MPQCARLFFILTRLHSLWKLLFTASSVMLAMHLWAGAAIAQSAATSNSAPIQNEDAPNVIPDQYIVVFKPDAGKDAVLKAQEQARSLGGEILHTYTSALLGFSARLQPEALKALRTLPDVAYIEADRLGKLDTVQPPNPPGNPPAGLDRIDQRLFSPNPPPNQLDRRYTYSETGAGVHAYVLDDGILLTHDEFENRAAFAHNAVAGETGSTVCRGHGTHVAGIIGGKTFGVAKQVTLHDVRVVSCGGFVTLSNTIAGVDWVSMNAIHPAVANMSLEFSAAGQPAGQPTTLDSAVFNALARGVTFVIAAGNGNTDACSVSPARVPDAITVGSVNPRNDTRAFDSNIGPCVDLFAPGVGILSAWNVSSTGASSNTGTSINDGTSLAAPHVAGVAARFLQTHPLAGTAQVWSAIDNASNVFGGTANWPGVIDAGTGSPNEMLHWGSLNDGQNDGDPHITTMDGVHYDFQSVGEFIALRDGNGLEIQTRQTPISTTFTIPNAYTGLSTCVSLNTAVAARVGKQRITFQPNLNGNADPAGLQLRVDGSLTQLPANGLNLTAGSRIMPSPGGGIEIDFPDETVLIVTPGWWVDQSKWYLNVDVFRSTAREGLMGALAPGSWLPGLPDGSSLGPRPVKQHQRYLDLYGKFADAWRVNDKTSLFDYAEGSSTAAFTLRAWPPEKPPCIVPASPVAKPVAQRVARKLCRGIIGKSLNANCVFDVAMTGEPGFAKTYELSQKIQAGFTTTTLSAGKERTKTDEPMVFTAFVAKGATGSKGFPTGTIQFILDGEMTSEPVKLDRRGRAVWQSPKLKAGEHHAMARYIPKKDTPFLASSSFDIVYTVKGSQE